MHLVVFVYPMGVFLVYTHPPCLSRVVCIPFFKLSDHTKNRLQMQTVLHAYFRSSALTDRATLESSTGESVLSPSAHR